MATYNSSNYQYTDSLNIPQLQRLPESLMLVAPSEEAVILRLLLGRINIESNNKKTTVKQNYNYTILPYNIMRGLTFKSINNALSVSDILDNETQNICNKYFDINRKNTCVHQQVLFELTSYFFESKSPISAFVHIYRCLEFTSYCFPLMYASLTRDYKGSYKSLQDFLSGKGTGELKFMRHFLDTLFKDDPVYDYCFDININVDNIESLRIECEHVFKEEFAYSFTHNCISIPFSSIMSMIITLRNRYFHFLIGQGQYNFSAMNYDINDFFSALNPFFINWFAIVFCKIVQFGVNSVVMI